MIIISVCYFKYIIFQIETEEENYISLTTSGQDITTKIVNKAQEIFDSLRLGNKTKLQEKLQEIGSLFLELKHTYFRLNEYLDKNMNYIEVESIIPYMNTNYADKKDLELYEERDELKKQVQLKSEQIKEVIHQMRIIIYEINVGLERSKLEKDSVEEESEMK